MGKTTLVEWKINNALTHSLCPNLKELEMFSHNITNEILTIQQSWPQTYEREGEREGWREGERSDEDE